MTKAAAMGLKCKILLFAASPLFNDNEPYCTAEPQEAVINHQVWYGGYKPELWKACLTACEEFFQALQVNGHYELVQAVGDTNDAYRAAFNKAYFLRENSELLISTRIIGKYNWDWWYYWGSRSYAVLPYRRVVRRYCRGKEPWTDYGCRRYAPGSC